MARILVTGGRGMIGSYSKRVFAADELMIAGSKELDICSPQHIADCFAAFRPQTVLHLAAATNVDRCQLDKDYAFRVNEEGTRNIAEACSRQGCTLVYASSGAVFDGQKPQPYLESDPVAPVNIYGESKLAGEAVVRELKTPWFIARSGWVFGGVSCDVKFVGKLASMMLSGQKQLRAVDDKIGTPTYALDFLHGIRRLLAGAPSGVYHLGNDGFASRFQIAQEIRRILRLNNTTILPVSSDEFPLPAPRGRSEAISSCRLSAAGIAAHRPWQEALNDYLVNDYLPALSAAAS